MIKTHLFDRYNFATLLTEKNAAVDTSNAFYFSNVMCVEVTVASTVCTVQFVQVTAHVFVAVIQVHIL